MYRLGLVGQVVADRGFDWNSGRSVYKPNLDDYPENLAYQFTKTEMAGGEFRWAYAQVEKAIEQVKSKAGKEKFTSKEMVEVRNKLNRDFLFAGGVLKEKVATKIGAKTKTVWLSDDTLIKQLNSRAGDKYFNVETYEFLPEVINNPEIILKNTLKNGREKLFFLKKIKGKWGLVVIKHLKQEKELFAESFFLTTEKHTRGLLEEYEILKSH